MSARRARIKPVVTSFPARRKKTDVADNTKDVTDDDFIASLFTFPTTEDNVMDGIVPLQPGSSAPKPEDLLNEPALPVPIKVRPKLRPVPRLGPSTGSRVQASVLEAKDDSRRALLSGGGPSTSAAPRQGHDSHGSPHSAMHSLPNSPDETQLASEKEEAARKAAIAQGKNKEDQTKMEIDVAPVPQIKLGPDGEIMLDEQNLVIKQSEKRKISSTVVHEGPSTASTSSGYRRTKRTAVWTDTETARFYRALASLGTDFMFMENLFPDRTRRELNLKYKKEERVNTANVEEALRSRSKWDPARLENEFQAEREEEEKAEEEKQRTMALKRMMKQARQRVPKSLAAKSLGESVMPAPDIDEPMLQRPKAKKQKSTASSQSATTRRVMPILDSTPNKKDTKSKDKAPFKQHANTPKLPKNLIEGSIVVCRSKNPNCPPNRKLQTFMAKAGGRQSPVTLPPKLLKTIVTFMDTGVLPNYMSAGCAGSADSAGPAESAGSAGSAASSSNAANEDSRPRPTDPTPGVI